MNNLKVSSCVKITDQTLKSFGQLGKIKAISGIYEITLPEGDTPDFLKNLNPYDISELAGMGVIRFSIFFLDNKALDDIKEVSVLKEGQIVENCSFRKIKTSYEVKPENYSSTIAAGIGLCFVDTQFLTEDQFEDLGFTVFSEEYRNYLREKEKKDKWKKFLFSLPFVSQFYLRNHFKKATRNLSNPDFVEKFSKEIWRHKQIENFAYPKAQE